MMCKQRLSRFNLRLYLVELLHTGGILILSLGFSTYSSSATFEDSQGVRADVAILGLVRFCLSDFPSFKNDI